jgi:hypothetical protein
MLADGWGARLHRAVMQYLTYAMMADDQRFLKKEYEIVTRMFTLSSCY